MDANWIKISDLGFRYEGGYINDPDDPGGATNFGITIGTLSAYRGRRCSVADVRNLQKPEAREIYRKNYWNVIQGDDLPAGVDEVIYDYAINSGPSAPVKCVQRILGLRVDGHMGAVTIDAIRKEDPEELIRKICQARLKFMRSLRIFKKFGKGWTARVNSCERIAIGMATGAYVSHFVDLGEDYNGYAKADGREVKGIRSTLEGAGLAGSGVSVGVEKLSGLAEEFKGHSETLDAYSSISPYIHYIAVTVLVISLGITAYAMYRKWQEA